MTDETAEDTRLARLCGGKAAVVLEAIPTLTDDELVLLHNHEGGAGKRVSLLVALRCEADARAEAADSEARARADAQRSGDAVVAAPELYGDGPSLPDGKALRITAGAVHPDEAVLAGVSRVVFTDAHGLAIGAMPMLSFCPGDFDSGDGRALLVRAVAVPETVGGGTVSRAYLLDDDGTVSGRADLAEPLTLAEGRVDTLAARSLVFEGGAN